MAVQRATLAKVAAVAALALAGTLGHAGCTLAFTFTWCGLSPQSSSGGTYLTHGTASLWPQQSPWVQAPVRGQRPSLTALAAGTAAVAAVAALVVQNKGGRHGEIGYHLAQKLHRKGLHVTLVNDSAADRCQLPFSAYPDLEGQGVDVLWADLAQPGTFTRAAEAAAAAVAGGRFDYIFDNEDVCPGEVQDTCQRWQPWLYTYISSADVYEEPAGDVPLLEEGHTRASSPHLEVERRAAGLAGLPCCAIRPQYIYGPLANMRDYLDYFFDRMTRGLPVPIPGDGHQRTTLTHVEDVAGMLAKFVETPVEHLDGQAFNCASDRRVSYLKLLADVGACLGMDREVAKASAVFYQPGSINVPDSESGFPFRDVHFGVGVGKAKRELRWAPSKRLDKEALAAYLVEYQRLGLDRRPVDLRVDDAIFAAAGQQLESAVEATPSLAAA